MKNKHRGISRREFLKKSQKLIIGSSLASQFLFNIGCSNNQDEVRIGYLPITDATPLLIAYDNGYFKEEGLKLVNLSILRTWSSLVDAFLSDKVNVVHFLMPIPIRLRYNNNSKVKIIAWDHTNGSALTVGAEAGINSFKDLGGKNIAVPFWHSMHNIILQMGIRKFGLKAVIKPQTESLKKDEVNLLILPPSEMPVSLAGKKIDGYIVAEPFNALGEETIKAKILRFTGDVWKNHPCCVIVMKENYIKEKPVFVQKVMNSIVRAQGWIINNREKTAWLLSKENKGYLPVSEKVLRRVFMGYELNKYGNNNIPLAIKHPKWHMNRIDFQPYPYSSATRFIFNEMKETLIDGNNDYLKKYNEDFILNDLVEKKFVTDAIKNLGGINLFPVIDMNSPWEREEVIDI